LAVFVPSVLSRFFAFLRRHLWSLSCSVLSAWSFFELAEEMRDGELGPLDGAATAMVAGWRGQLDLPMLFLTRTGGGLGMTLLCVASAAALFALHKRKQATFVLVCGAGAAVLNFSLKLLLQRARPTGESLYLIATPSSFSFPSGHTLGAFCILASLTVVAHVSAWSKLWRWAITVLAVAYAVGVAVSRVYFGVHYPSDVIGGALAAAAWVAALTGWFYPHLLPGEAAVTAPPVASDAPSH
jgi:undecaprenyl-diphosphatase